MASVRQRERARLRWCWGLTGQPISTESLRQVSRWSGWPRTNVRMQGRRDRKTRHHPAAWRTGHDGDEAVYQRHRAPPRRGSVETGRRGESEGESHHRSDAVSDDGDSHHHIHCRIGRRLGRLRHPNHREGHESERDDVHGCQHKLHDDREDDGSRNRWRGGGVRGHSHATADRGYPIALRSCLRLS